MAALFAALNLVGRRCCAAIVRSQRKRTDFFGSCSTTAPSRALQGSSLQSHPFGPVVGRDSGEP